MCQPNQGNQKKNNDGIREQRMTWPGIAPRENCEAQERQTNRDIVVNKTHFEGISIGESRDAGREEPWDRLRARRVGN